MTVWKPAGAQPCSLHGDHVPQHKTTEWHHFVVVAWQLRTPVAHPPSPGQDPEGRGMLWDNRGGWICPTGHRNTHAWIDRLMHRIAEQGDEDVAAAVRALRPRGRASAEFGVAQLALVRFQPFGSLLELTAASEWGQV